MEVKEKINTTENIQRRNTISYLIISFTLGISSISEMAIQFFFKDELKLQPAKMSQILSITLTPWMIKPLFGLLTDLLPIFGYRRKFYIILCGIINSICWIIMSMFHLDLFMYTLLLFIINSGLSFSSVLGEAIVVELSQFENNNVNKAKDYVSLFFFIRYTGALISAYLKGLFIDIMTIRMIFLIAGIVPLLLIISGIILIEENKKEPVNQINNYDTLNENNYVRKKNLCNEFKDFIFQKAVIIPTMFIIIFMATPSYSDPFFYFLTNELKFSASDLGKISVCTTIATLIAILMYKQYFKDTNFKTMIIFGTIVSFFISFMSLMVVSRRNLILGISDFWFVLFSSSFITMLGELILMPMLSLACMLCPKDLEGTVYSLFMSALNLGGILSNLNGSFLTEYLGITSTDYKNLYELIMISNILTLLPLPALLFISNSYFQPEKKDHNESPYNYELENQDSMKDNLKI